jgi:DinB family protein
MNIIDFFRIAQKRLHDGLRKSVCDLTVDEWHYRTGGTGNSIAFIFWHCVRTEDGILRFILQGRPPIWNEGKWSERFTLPSRVQGTGMPMEEAQALRIDNPALFLQYAEQVWKEYEEYLASITDGGAELSERVVTVKPIGTIPAIMAIGQICIMHLYTHQGEIAELLGAQGKQGMTS